MNIEITGCNNCVFRYSHNKDYQNYCLLSENIEKPGYIFINTENPQQNGFRTDIPENCPIKLNNNGQITIKIKK